MFLLEGILAAGLIAWLFYDSALAVLFLIPVVVLVYRKKKREEQAKRVKELSTEFRDLLAAVTTALRAGYSAENAFREAQADLTAQYGSRAPMVTELARLTAGLSNQVPLEKLLKEMAERIGISEAAEFAEVFAIATRSGGNLVHILSETETMLRSRMDVEEEIRVLTAGRKMEQKIMSFVPFLIILYISVTSKGFFSSLYHNPGGIILMSICLVVYLFACALGEKAAGIEM